MKQHMTTTSPSEQLSALVDGELALADCAELLSGFAQDELLIKKWSAYHLIGDALRSSKPAVENLDMAFAGRVQRRLSQEALPVAVRQTIDAPPAMQLVLPLGNDVPHLWHQPRAANDEIFRWKAVAGLACVAATAAMAWNVFGFSSGSDSAQLASNRDRSSEQVIVASPQGPIVRDVRLNEFLAAHRQLGSTSAAQMPSAFLRNATFDAPQADGAR